MTTVATLRKRWRTPPGSEILKRIHNYWLPLKPGHGQPVTVIFDLLEGLPYRDEVANGRDFRGAQVGGARELALLECDFTAAELGNFFHCDLSGSCFDESKGNGSSFHNVINTASFLKANLPNAIFDRAQVLGSRFDEARLERASFEDTDLRGSSFRHANLKEASFIRTNLIGCDFRGAILDDAILLEAIIDPTTDFRGASLIRVYDRDHYNTAGHLVARGTDWRIGLYDDTTRYTA